MDRGEDPAAAQPVVVQRGGAVARIGIGAPQRAAGPEAAADIEARPARTGSVRRQIGARLRLCCAYDGHGSKGGRDQASPDRHPPYFNTSPESTEHYRYITGIIEDA